VRNCINPAHLEPVTPEENRRRSPIPRGAHYANRTHCNQGHEFTPENTYWRKQTNDPTRFRRVCRACKRDSWRRAAQKKAGV
jgi:hypothetical protein